MDQDRNQGEASEPEGEGDGEGGGTTINDPLTRSDVEAPRAEFEGRKPG